MKHAIPVFALLLFALCTSFDLCAQIGAKKQHDVRVEKLLNESGLTFEVVSDGNFKLIFRYDDERTQVIWINSATETYQNLEIREIWSIAEISNGPMPSTVSRTLLKDNAAKKLGSWKIAVHENREFAVFYAQIAAESDKQTLQSILRLVGKAADEMEKQLNGKDDY